MWVQQHVRSGAVELRKVNGKVNPADVFTKYLESFDRIPIFVELFGCDYREGRPAAAPLLRKGQAAAQVARDKGRSQIT